MGGKSYLGCNWIGMACIRYSGINTAIARKTLKSIRESTLKTFWFVLRQWGLQKDVHYSYDSVKGVIEFWNNSTVTLIEMADTPQDPDFQRFGSSEYTAVFVDEAGELSEKSVDILYSRIRWKIMETFKVPKMLLSCNPSMNFIKRRFVVTDDNIPVVPDLHEYYVPFSVFDNPDANFRAVYEASLRKIKDPSARQRLLYGNWTYVDSNDASFYSGFNGEIHLVDKLLEKGYDSDKPLIVGFDFNVQPYMTTLLAQIDYGEKIVYFLEEIIGTQEKKLNNTPSIGRHLKDKRIIRKHEGGIIITGDPSAKASSTKVEQDVNDFTIIRDNLKPIVTELQTLVKQPPQKVRGEWINEILSNNYDGWSINIDTRCRKLIDDLTMQKKNQDGGKEKKKYFDPKLQIKYELLGHASDTFDYILCKFLPDSWMKYKKGTDVTQAPVTAVIIPTWNY